VERIDVAVVGGGPAGATAARLLSARGARVVLFEARPIPRSKLCGGGLTPKAIPYLAGVASATIERQIENVELVGGRLPSVHLHLPEAPVAMVERAPFDAALVGAAMRAGVDIRDAWPIHDVIPEDDGVRLRGPRGETRADVLVAADGEPSRVARRLGFAAPRRRSLALEVDLPFAPGRREDELQLRFGVSGGYAWYFPKGDHANVGIMSWRQGGQRRLGEQLKRYARSLGLPLDQRRVKGHWIPQGLRSGPIVRGRILLVGDAAATSDPFFGEGISYAMASAALAARAIGAWADRATPLSAYDLSVRRAIGPALRRLMVVAEIADRMPTLSLVALRAGGWARQEAVHGVAGTHAPFLMPGAISPRVAAPAED
jgi:geranylgeranyl reductase family protein